VSVVSRFDVVALLVIGIGASAVATMLFTQAFAYGNPTTPLLLQKLQPIIAILGAYVLLSGSWCSARCRTPRPSSEAS
jgi:drug/metabolite transporter (DMT)-like permease